MRDVKARQTLNYRRLLIIGVAILLVIALIAGGAAWYSQHLTNNRKRTEFLRDYRAAMEVAIRRYYFMFEELPAGSEELGRTIREPWVFDGIVTFGFNRPTLEEGMLSFERDAFESVLPDCKGLISTWRKELDTARRPLVEREGNLAAQLDLFVDTSFERAAGYRFLTQLQEQRGVEEETLAEFLDACNKVLDKDRVRRIMIRLKVAPDLATAARQKSDRELAFALEEIETLKQSIIKQVEQHDAKRQMTD